MRQVQRFSYLSIPMGLIVVTACVVGLFTSRIRAEEQDIAQTKRIVAKVNGKPIYEEQIKPEVEAALKRFKKYGMRKENAALVKRLRKRALDRVIGEELIHQQSQKIPVDNIDEKVNLKLKAMEMKYGAGERFERHLKSRRLTLEGVKGSLRARVYVEEYLKSQGISEPDIPEERIRETYDRNPETYSRDETIKVSHILVGVSEGAAATEKAQTRQEAEGIHKEILEGKDFAEMAKKHSDCNSASGGGNLGYVKKGYMPEEFDKVAFAMETGAVSGVVATKFGYHIINVNDKKSAGISPYEDVKEFIRKFLQEEESRKLLAAHRKELKRKAKIEVLLDEP